MICKSKSDIINISQFIHNSLFTGMVINYLTEIFCIYVLPSQIKGICVLNLVYDY